MDTRIIVGIIIAIIIVIGIIAMIYKSGSNGGDTGGGTGGGGDPGGGSGNSTPSLDPINFSIPLMPNNITSTVTTNDSAGQGVLAFTGVTNLDTREFIAVYSNYCIGILANSTLAWKPMAKNATVATTVTQITNDYLSALDAVIASGTINYNLFVLNDHNSIWPYSTTADVIGSTVTLNAIIISGDFIATSDNKAYIVITDGYSIKVITNESGTIMIYYYFMETALNGKSIVQIALDSACNSFLLLSDGTCACLNTTFTPSMYQNGTFTILAQMAGMTSITVDKTNNIIYGVISAKTGDQVLQLSESAQTITWSVLTDIIPQPIDNLNPSSDTLLTFISLYSMTTTGVASLPTITYVVEIGPGNVLESSILPSDSNFSIMVSTVSGLYYWSKTSQAWLKQMDIAIQYSNIKLASYNGDIEIYALESFTHINSIVLYNQSANAFNPIAQYTYSTSVIDYDIIETYLEPNSVVVVRVDIDSIYLSTYSITTGIKTNRAIGTCTSGACKVTNVAVDTSLNVFYLNKANPSVINYIANALTSNVVSTIPIPSTTSSCLSVDKQNGILYYYNITADKLYYINQSTNTGTVATPVYTITLVTSDICPAWFSSTRPSDIVGMSCWNPSF